MNKSKYIDALSCLFIFDGVDSIELYKILHDNRYEIMEYDKGQIVHLQGEVTYNMDIILTGEVAVQNIDEDGKVLTINVFGSMNIIAANLIFSTKNYYPMTVVANTKVKILHMPCELVLMLCKSNDRFMQNFITIISDRTVSLTDKIHSITLKTIRQRLIDFIRYEYHLQKSLIIKLAVSKKNLAQRFGIERSSLSRELNKMRRDGLVDFDSRSITIKDKSIL